MGVTLPCQLEAKTISEGVLVQWTLVGNPVDYEVATYDGKNAQNPVKENKAYLGRTNFFLSEVTKGNLSLHLKNVMVSDKGKYICSVFLENQYNEVVVDLNVAGEWNVFSKVPKPSKKVLLTSYSVQLCIFGKDNGALLAMRKTSLHSGSLPSLTSGH